MSDLTTPTVSQNSLTRAGTATFDRIKTPVFWFACGYALALYLGSRKKIAA